MPNRILREGILTSERVNALTWEAEVFYRRLMSVVDDFGRYSAHPSLLRAALYPLKLDSVRDANMERLLALVEKARLVRVYDVAGKRYLELLDFKQQVRAKDSKFPQPPSDAKRVPSKCAADAPVFGDEDEDEGVSGGGLVGFAEFWDAWPKHKRKTAKDQCQSKWQSKGCATVSAQILKAVKAWAASPDWTKNGGDFIPAPLVWLNQSRWEALPAASAPGPVSPSVSPEIAKTRALLESQQISPEQIEANRVRAAEIRAQLKAVG